jgi:hypothetical protein
MRAFLAEIAAKRTKNKAAEGCFPSAESANSKRYDAFSFRPQAERLSTKAPSSFWV